MIFFQHGSERDERMVISLTAQMERTIQFEMTRDTNYIHGTHPEEQRRLALLNELTNESFLGFLDIKPGYSILEAGSGTGILADLVAKRFPRSHITGVEISPDQISEARKNFSETPNLEFIEGDAQSLDLEQNSCDLVYCRYLLEHLHEPGKAISEIYRVLKPGGAIFLQENNILICVFYPDCPVFNKVWKEFAGLQARLGGDAEIGKKLFFILKESGFCSIELSIAPEIHFHGMPTFEPWIENLEGNIAGAREMLIQSGRVAEESIDIAISELCDLKVNPFGSAYFYWNRASAKKPQA